MTTPRPHPEASATDCERGKDLDIACVWNNGAVSYTDTAVMQKYIALYGEPKQFKFVPVLELANR